MLPRVAKIYPCLPSGRISCLCSTRVFCYIALFLTGMAEHKDSVKLCEEIDG